MQNFEGYVLINKLNEISLFVVTSSFDKTTVENYTQLFLEGCKERLDEIREEYKNSPDVQPWEARLVITRVENNKTIIALINRRKEEFAFPDGYAKESDKACNINLPNNADCEALIRRGMPAIYRKDEHEQKATSYEDILEEIPSIQAVLMQNDAGNQN